MEQQAQENTQQDAPPQEQTQEKQPVMSKRQQKRLAKMEKQQEAKRARRESAKEDKAKAKEAKHEAINSMLAAMTEEEREEWHKKQKEKRLEMAALRQAAKERQHQALSAPQKVAIDLDFPGLMNPSELKSLCQQLSYSYSSAVHGDAQLHLHLLGAGQDLREVMAKQMPGHVHWAATQSELSFRDFFKDRLGDLVYLTADSPNELQQLDPTKVYVLGGLVDRNRHKGICFRRAQEAGVATARLPIGQHFKLHTSAVITVNQVVDIISRLQQQPDWRAVLEAVLPGRKKADGDGASGGGGGSSEEPQGPAPAAAAAAAAGQEAAAAGEEAGVAGEAAGQAAPELAPAAF